MNVVSHGAGSIGIHDRDHVIGVKWWYEVHYGQPGYDDGRPPALSEADWDADEVKQMFSHCGRVEKVVLPWLGAAEVRFKNKESVAKALEMHKTFYTGVAF